MTDKTTEVPTEHSSLVGGSTASRRINCPGSYLREQKAPKSQGSHYAREGTALHEMIAQVLDKDKLPEQMLPFTHNQPEKAHSNGMVEPSWEMTITEEKWDELGAPALAMFDDFLGWLEDDQDGQPSSYMIEERAEFPGIPGAFGTSDVPFRCGKVGGIWDWKFGRNHVSAEDNEQLMFYFAALRAKYPKFFEGIDRVMLCISQPLCNDQEPETWETTLEDIEAFCLDLQDAVKEAVSPDAHIEKGPWCTYADCKAVCELHISAAVKLGEAMRRMQLDEAAAEEDPTTPPQIDDMDAFLAKAMELAPAAEEWAKHIAAITQQRIEEGHAIPGWKIVAKKSSGRDWTLEEEKIVRRLQSRGLKAADYYARKLISPTQAEKKLKALGKDLPEDLYEKKASSGFTLTPEGDPRPEAATVAMKAKALGGALAAMIKGDIDHD